jgi:SAM-dependent methyltransferase
MAEALFDEEARRGRRQRALRREPQPFLADRVVGEWLERLAPISRRFDRVLVTGTPPALHARLVGIGQQVRFADTIDLLAEEAEASLDLILVMGELEARNELPLLLRIIASRLAPGGLLAGALPGGQSLPILRAALHAADRAGGAFAARSHPRVEPGALAGLLGDAGLKDAVVDVDRVTLRYRSLERLVSDLRDHGATNVLQSRPRHGLGKAGLNAARAAFDAAAEAGIAEEKIDILHYAGWAGSSSERP